MSCDLKKRNHFFYFHAARSLFFLPEDRRRFDSRGSNRPYIHQAWRKILHRGIRIVGFLRPDVAIKYEIESHYFRTILSYLICARLVFFGTETLLIKNDRYLLNGRSSYSFFKVTVISNQVAWKVYDFVAIRQSKWFRLPYVTRKVECRVRPPQARRSALKSILFEIKTVHDCVDVKNLPCTATKRSPDSLDMSDSPTTPTV